MAISLLRSKTDPSIYSAGLGTWTDESADISTQLIGAWSHLGVNFGARDLHTLLIDEVRLYNVQMTAEQIALLASDRGSGVTVTCSNSLTADSTGDCVVDLQDFAVLADQWLDCGDINDPACRFFGVP